MGRKGRILRSCRMGRICRMLKILRMGRIFAKGRICRTPRKPRINRMGRMDRKRKIGRMGRILRLRHGPTPPEPAAPCCASPKTQMLLPWSTVCNIPPAAHVPKKTVTKTFVSLSKAWAHPKEDLIYLILCASGCAWSSATICVEADPLRR